MINEEKSSLRTIGNNPVFKDIIQKFSTNSQLSEPEITYILTSAILFLKQFERDKRYTSYADFAYYIVLKYSINTGDYLPLYDFSVNFGFYPIAKAILDDKRLKDHKINNLFIDVQLNKFKNGQNYYETLEQYSESKRFLNDKTFEKSFIAPTSFGKSSVIVDYIRALKEVKAKIAIVVPTKSLLMQTYQMIKGADLQRKIIIHDEMFNNEESFIAVFTQERSLRLLSRTKTYFDILFIDEAHNILAKDDRSILLSRLIANNRALNHNQKVVYLSPLIENINNLKIKDDQSISSHVIKFNIKEPEIFEYRLNNEVYMYNRFVDQFYKIGKSNDKFSYLKSNSKKKNFIYLYSPRKIETLAKDLCNSLPEAESSENISQLEKTLKREVHKDFYGVKYLKYGLVYLHGKIPDLIKEYLESKFKNTPELKYIVANSVILEGMNLPIDNLFVLNTYSLDGKELINLIGRVNRLNTIFSAEKNNLEKLLPKAHFINSEEYGSGNNMANKIKLLRSRVFIDKVENPILDSFEMKKGLSPEEKVKIIKIQNNEQFLSSQTSSERDEIKKYLIENGINAFYHNPDLLIAQVIFVTDSIKNNKNFEWQTRTFMDKLYYLFLSNSTNISDFEFSRLVNQKARNYYDNYILISRKRSLNENIISQNVYFKEKAKGTDSKFYMGASYGEEPKETVAYTNAKFNVYVDLSKKSDEELINLAVVKLKMEDDFISFKLNKFIVMLYDFDFISRDEYNTYIYGTTDKQKISLTKFGLGINLITRLDEADQLKNLYFDPFNNLKGNSDFETYKNSLNDFYKFEINRFLA